MKMAAEMVTMQPPEAEETGRVLPWSLQRKRGSAGTLISNFYPPELRENRLLLF